MDDERTGEIEFTARWWRDELPRGTYQAVYAIDDEPAPPSGRSKRSRRRSASARAPTPCTLG
ncbi:MAG TPA: hypothetical protein VI462_08320 [Acidimicrobiia bacterium]